MTVAALHVYVFTILCFDVYSSVCFVKRAVFFSSFITLKLCEIMVQNLLNFQLFKYYIFYERFISCCSFDPAFILINYVYSENLLKDIKILLTI